MTNRARRLACSIVGVFLFLGCALWLTQVITRRGRSIDKLNAHNGALAAKLARLKQECITLNAMKAGLRVDPVCVERRIRTTFGLIREGERTYTPMRVSFRRAAPRKPVQSSRAHEGNRLLQGCRVDCRSLRFYLLSIIFSAMAGVFLMSFYTTGQEG